MCSVQSNLIIQGGVFLQTVTGHQMRLCNTLRISVIRAESLPSPYFVGLDCYSESDLLEAGAPVMQYEEKREKCGSIRTSLRRAYCLICLLKYICDRQLNFQSKASLCCFVANSIRTMRGVTESPCYSEAQRSRTPERLFLFFTREYLKKVLRKMFKNSFGVREKTCEIGKFQPLDIFKSLHTDQNTAIKSLRKYV